MAIRRACPLAALHTHPPAAPLPPTHLFLPTRGRYASIRRATYTYQGRPRCTAAVACDILTFSICLSTVYVKISEYFSSSCTCGPNPLGPFAGVRTARAYKTNVPNAITLLIRVVVLLLLSVPGKPMHEKAHPREDSRPQHHPPCCRTVTHIPYS